MTGSLIALLLAAQGAPVYVGTPQLGGACDGARVQIRATDGAMFCCQYQITQAPSTYGYAWSRCGPYQDLGLLYTGSASSRLPAGTALTSKPLGLLIGEGSSSLGTLSTYLGATCTNQFPRALSTRGAPTCASVNLSLDTAATALPPTKGGTGFTSFLIDTIPVATAASVYTARALPACSSSTSALRYDTTGHAFSCGTVLDAVPDATGAVTGGIRLTGDLGGTATAPSVIDDSHAHTGSTVSALGAGAITTGILAGARGGVGVALPTCVGTDKLTADGTQVSCATDQTSGGGAYGTIQDEGTGLTQRATLNFTGSGVACADDSTRTTCTITSGGGGADLGQTLRVTSNAFGGY
jgi:hypothetical protein